MKRFFLLVLIAAIALASILVLLPRPGHIPVLMYHFVVPEKQVGPTSLDVSVKDFDQQLWFLDLLQFRPITIDEYEAIVSGTLEPNGREVLITFDDGNKSFYEYALPVLEKYGFPAANFLIWDDTLNDTRSGSIPVAKAKELVHHPLVRFGSHSLTHARLTDVNSAQLREEVIGSKRKLEELLNVSIDHFVYPTGAYNEEAIAAVKDAGYALAFTTTWKEQRGREETLFSITRHKVSPSTHLLSFWFKLSGLEDQINQLRRSR